MSNWTLKESAQALAAKTVLNPAAAWPFPTGAGRP